jgi:hypothetical protein
MKTGQDEWLGSGLARTVCMGAFRSSMRVFESCFGSAREDLRQLQDAALTSSVLWTLIAASG